MIIFNSKRFSHETFIDLKNENKFSYHHFKRLVILCNLIVIQDVLITRKKFCNLFIIFLKLFNSYLLHIYELINQRINT